MKLALSIIVLLASACFAQIPVGIVGGSVTASQVATPTYDNDTGSYVTSVSVTISDATSGAAITYCTATGSDCNPVGGTSYTVPVVVTVNTTHLCSYATKSGMTDSATKCATYTITSGIAAVNNSLKSCTSSPCTSSTINMTGATLLTVVSMGFDTGCPVITSSPANTWTPRTTYFVSSQNYICISYAVNPTVSSSMTFTGTGGGGYPTIFYAGWSGTLTTSGVYDSTTGNGNNAGTSSACQTGTTGTLSQTGELVIAGVAQSGANGLTFSIDSSLAKTGEQATGNTYEGGAWAYLIASATTALNPTWTLNASGSPTACTIAGFKHP